MTIHGLNHSNRPSSQSLSIKLPPAPTIKAPTIPIVEDQEYRLISPQTYKILKIK